jgi:hypothetical protein
VIRTKGRASIRRITAAGVVGLALVLAGCTSAESTDIPAEGEATISAVPDANTNLTVQQAAMKQAAENTAASGSARFRADIKGSAGADGAAGDILLDGLYNFDPQQIQTQIVSQASGQKQNAELVIVDGKSYVKMAELGSDKWIEMPIAQLGLAESILNPQSSMGNLADLQDLKEVGKEKIDGVATTKYTGTMGIKEALAGADVTGEPGDISGEAEVKVWIDSENRLVRVDTDVNAKIEGEKVKSSTTMTFSDYGIAVNVQAPAPENVQDVSTLQAPSSP